MKDLYEIFGLTSDCTDEELAAKYSELKAKYGEERFAEGEKGNEAARKLTELETAYQEISSLRQEQAFSVKSDSGLYKDVEEAIKSGNLSAAQDKLDSFNERNPTRNNMVCLFANLRYQRNDFCLLQAFHYHDVLSVQVS